MDGNGRWAERRGLPRTAGHHAGMKPVRTCIQECARLGVEVLTLFAFSSENFKRPVTEVGILMQLFLDSLDREIDELASRGTEVRFIGDRDRLGAPLVERMEAAEAERRVSGG